MTWIEVIGPAYALVSGEKRIAIVSSYGYAEKSTRERWMWKTVWEAGEEASLEAAKVAAFNAASARTERL